MSDGVDRKRIRRHLLIFSLAAPLMAIFTFVLLSSVCLLIYYFKKKKSQLVFFSRELMIHIQLIPPVLLCYLVRVHFYLLLQYMFYLKFNLIMKIDNFVRLNLLFLLLDVVFLLFFQWAININNIYIIFFFLSCKCIFFFFFFSIYLK